MGTEGQIRLPCGPYLTSREKRMYRAATPLTVMENKIVDYLLIDGPSNDEIAQHFCISPDTVKRHFSNIMDKTGYSTRLELAVRLLHERYQQRLKDVGEGEGEGLLGLA